MDAGKDMIASVNLDGKDLKHVLSKVSQLQHPFSVGIHKNLMYWDDWKSKSMYLADKNTGKGLTQIKTSMSGAMDLKVFSKTLRTGNNSCTPNLCSYLCAPVPPKHDSGEIGNNNGKGYVCLCPNELKMEKSPSTGEVSCKCQDGSTPTPTGACPLTLEGLCTEHQFKCNSSHCNPKNWVCDGSDDCSDGSDEDIERCKPSSKEKCGSEQFMCKTETTQYTHGRCIPSSWRCDFDHDCIDGSDEANCTHNQCGGGETGDPNQFRCESGQCISMNWRCDLENDCQDGSDEKNCTKAPTKCKDNEFQCGNKGQCIPSSWQCDGEVDCPQQEDEKECNNHFY